MGLFDMFKKRSVRGYKTYARPQPAKVGTYMAPMATAKPKKKKGPTWRDRAQTLRSGIETIGNKAQAFEQRRRERNLERLKYQTESAKRQADLYRSKAQVAKYREQSQKATQDRFGFLFGAQPGRATPMVRKRKKRRASGRVIIIR